MDSIIKNIFLFFLGLIVGTIVTYLIVQISPYFIPLPNGYDATTPESRKASQALFENKHYIFPLLSHAIGTFFGAFVASRLSSSVRLYLPLSVGLFFLVLGLIASFMYDTPRWFFYTDNMISYLPMAYLGGILGKILRKS